MEFFEAIDQGSAHFMINLHRPWLTPVMIGLTRLGDRPLLLAILVTGLAALLLTGRTRRAVWLLRSWQWRFCSSRAGSDWWTGRFSIPPGPRYQLPRPPASLVPTHSRQRLFWSGSPSVQVPAEGDSS